MDKRSHWEGPRTSLDAEEKRKGPAETHTPILQLSSL